MKPISVYLLSIVRLLLSAQFANAQKVGVETINKPIYITSASDSVVLQANRSTIGLLASGAVLIKAGGTAGITIDGGEGDVNTKLLEKAQQSQACQV